MLQGWFGLFALCTFQGHFCGRIYSSFCLNNPLLCHCFPNLHQVLFEILTWCRLSFRWCFSALRNTERWTDRIMGRNLNSWIEILEQWLALILFHHCSENAHSSVTKRAEGLPKLNIWLFYKNQDINEMFFVTLLIHSLCIFSIIKF